MSGWDYWRGTLEAASAQAQAAASQASKFAEVVSAQVRTVRPAVLATCCKHPSGHGPSVCLQCNMRQYEM